MPLPSATVPPQTVKSPSWLAVAAMLTDLAFETDPLGRFTLFGPGKALGQPAANLLGVELATLIDGGGGEVEAMTQAQLRSIITTICVECVAWHGRARLRLVDGTSRMFRLALAPRLSGGAVIGTFGLLFDLEAPELAPPERHGDEGLVRHHGATLLDPETGLWSRRAFGDEMARRFDRLDVEDRPGTLLYLGFSRARALMRAPVAMRLAEELRDVVRPTDLLGRVDETTIGLWCDGMDHLTGGERASKFCIAMPPLLPEECAIRVGVATRWPGGMEDVQSVTEHAAAALRQAEMPREGMPPWQVWQND